MVNLENILKSEWSNKETILNSDWSIRKISLTLIGQLVLIVFSPDWSWLGSWSSSCRWSSCTAHAWWSRGTGAPGSRTVLTGRCCLSVCTRQWLLQQDPWSSPAEWSARRVVQPAPWWSRAHQQSHCSQDSSEQH